MNSFSNLEKKKEKEKHWCFIALVCLLIILIGMFFLQVRLSPVWKKPKGLVEYLCSSAWQVRDLCVDRDF